MIPRFQVREDGDRVWLSKARLKGCAVLREVGLMMTRSHFSLLSVDASASGQGRQTHVALFSHLLFVASVRSKNQFSSCC